MGGGAIAAALGCFIPKFADPDWTVTLPSWGGMQTHSAGIFIGYIIFILLMAWVAYKGVGRIRVLQNIGGPILLALLIGLLAWSVKIGSDAGFSFGDIMNQSVREGTHIAMPTHSMEILYVVHVLWDTDVGARSSL